MTGHMAIWIIAALATAGVILRPWRLPEAVWAVAGAALLLVSGLISLATAWHGVAQGTDVYLFLGGMMLLSETARLHGLFDWLAGHATRHACGSSKRLFFLIYAVGVAVTIFLSNDATAVVLTPAVAAAVKTAEAKNPLPYLLICAFVANAASFVLPISNPANLVIYHTAMPPLLSWLTRFTLPSVLSIAATFLVLRWSQRQELTQNIVTEVTFAPLSRGGKTAGFGIIATAMVLILASACGVNLGLPTAIAGAATVVIVLLRERQGPWKTLRGVSWGVLPLVAGLFVLVAALQKTGLIAQISTLLQNQSQHGVAATAGAAGVIIAVASNFMNNLPAGLIAGSVVQTAHVSAHVTSAVLIGVDIGPNLSVTGSLATILWLNALRREGITVSAWQFLKLGFLVMPPALCLALAASFTAL